MHTRAAGPRALVQAFGPGVDPREPPCEPLLQAVSRVEPRARLGARPGRCRGAADSRASVSFPSLHSPWKLVVTTSKKARAHEFFAFLLCSAFPEQSILGRSYPGTSVPQIFVKGIEDLQVGFLNLLGLNTPRVQGILTLSPYISYLISIYLL